MRLHLLAHILNSFHNSKSGRFFIHTIEVNCAVLFWLVVPVYHYTKLFFFGQKHNGPGFQCTLRQPKVKQGQNSVSQPECT
jgi:hypothetical protein